MNLPTVQAGQELIEKYGFEPRRVEVLDSSMVGDFVDCASMFYLKHILGLRPAGGFESIALDWGSQWHKGMYAYYKESDGNEGNLDAALAAIADNWPEHIVPENDRMKRSRDRMLKQMFDYHSHWAQDNKRYEILRHEQYFDFENEDDGLRWCGRMDSVRRQTANNKIQVWDYKTTSAMGPRYFDQYELSFQFPGYVWAGNQMLTEPVLELKMDVMYTLSKTHDFFRRTFRYDAYRVREFVDNTKMILSQIYHLMDNHLYEPERWVKNWNNCTRYSTCMFFPVHNIHPKGDTRLRILQSDYEIDRWDPSDMGE